MPSGALCAAGEHRATPLSLRMGGRRQTVWRCLSWLTIGFFDSTGWKNAVIAPTGGKWRAAGLATVSVKFRLFSRLAHSYNPKPDDSLDQRLSLSPPVREITRAITSAHWFLREFRVYGGDAQLVSPKNLVQQFVDEQQQMLARYQEAL